MKLSGTQPHLAKPSDTQPHLAKASPQLKCSTFVTEAFCKGTVVHLMSGWCPQGNVNLILQGIFEIKS